MEFRINWSFRIRDDLPLKKRFTGNLSESRGVGGGVWVWLLVQTGAVFSYAASLHSSSSRRKVGKLSLADKSCI